MSLRARRVALTYGRFDMFHQGHVTFLQRVSQLADEVIVGCATDACALAAGAPCQMPYEDRRALLDSCRYVSRVIAQTDLNQQHSDIVNYNAGTLVMGMDCAGQYDTLQNIAQILYLPRAPRSRQPADLRPLQNVVGY